MNVILNYNVGKPKSIKTKQLNKTTKGTFKMEKKLQI